MPDADLAHPGTVEPSKVIAQLESHQVQTLSGGPAFIKRIVDQLLVEEKNNAVIEYIGLWGWACVGRLAIRYCQSIAIYSILCRFRSTEAEPICHHRMGEAHNTQRGMSQETPAICVLKLVNLPDIPDEGIDLASYTSTEVGEVIVSGAHVNESYIDNDDANRKNKVRDKAGVIWHRTGDRAQFDSSGLLWLVGRVKDLVHYQGNVFDPFLVDSVLCELDCVEQAALVESKRGVSLFVAPHPKPVQIESIELCLNSRGLRFLSTVVSHYR